MTYAFVFALFALLYVPTYCMVFLLDRYIACRRWTHPIILVIAFLAVSIFYNFLSIVEIITYVRHS